MPEQTYSGRRVVLVLAIIVVIVVALVMTLFFNGPRVDQMYKDQLYKN